MAKKENGKRTSSRIATTGKFVTSKSGKKRKELSADEMLLRIWKKTYATRHKRLDV